MVLACWITYKPTNTSALNYADVDIKSVTDKKEKESGKRNDSYFAADRRRRKKYMKIVIPAIIAIAAVSVVAALLYQPPEVLAISGVECHEGEATAFHVHAHLDVFVDGQEVVVPRNVGILSSCLFWLHTHDGDGIIHVEAPAPREYRVGQFIDIWSQTHTASSELFSSVSDKPVTAYVNGEEFDGNYRDILLASQTQIVLAYGEPPAEIPTYDFGSLR